jgi:NAD(P)-dependent dehydrogenase (short-subunit alcohol dehydrogenase family)
MTKNIAAELAPAVRVNAICAGAIATRSLSTVMEDEQMHADSWSGLRRGGRAIPRTSRAPRYTWPRPPPLE